MHVSSGNPHSIPHARNVYKDSILLLFLSYCFVDDLLTLRAASRQAVRYLLTGPLWVCALCRCIDTAREAGPSLGLTGCVNLTSCIILKRARIFLCTRS